jgi:rRNA maturation endonuclease Nob1
MIKLDFAVAISLYITLSSVVVLVIWVYLDRNRFKKYTSDDVYMWQCSICTHAYVDSVHKEISVCPVCGSYNKRGEYLVPKGGEA